jgi:SAM-dependent MidA family methyltransferase
MCPAQEMTPLARKLAARIGQHGPITFADYMGACLYDPEHGYYCRAANARSADYFTSVELHPVFARSLARQMEEMWHALGQPLPFLIVEPGAGSGLLAQQILEFLSAQLPDFYAAAKYVAVEYSAARRNTQSELLAPHLKAGRFESRSDLPENIPAGCIVSNEFFDALPVHRIVMQDGDLREIYIAHNGERFVELLKPLSSAAIAEYFARQEILFRQSQQAEAGIAACEWIRSAAARIERGFILTVDYGHDARELYDERHMRGTMLAYRGHASGEDFYASPGEQDLTSHVNFTALRLWGGDAGLETIGRVSQTQFLLAMARKNNFADLHDAGHDETDKLRGRLKFKTLIHPEGMGETFEVQIQKKRIGDVQLTGLQPL